MMAECSRAVNEECANLAVFRLLSGTIAPMDPFQENQETADDFSEPELDLLTLLLDQLESDEAMDIEEMDGFFAALHCGPDLVMPGEYVPEIVGQEYAFPDKKTAQLFLDLVVYHWNAVGDALRENEFFEPILLEDEEGKAYGNNWAIGFMRGVNMRRPSWQAIFDNDSEFALMVPILALVHENDPDPEMRTYDEPPSEELRANLLAGLSVSVRQIYSYFGDHRRRAAIERRESASFHRVRRIGRNDPCYCGSGKKYKKCCGGIAVN